MDKVTTTQEGIGERLLSLDVFRGLTMFLLIAEFTHIFSLLVDPALEGTIIAAVGRQFHHHPWNGLRFWDLIQPFFMFIVGVAMPFSFGRRWARGDSWKRTFGHAALRSGLLLFLGWALYCIEPGRITFRFDNVLAQLSVTYLFAFLIMRKPVRTQIVISLGLILLTEGLYRFWPVAGFDQAFVPDKNFGAWFDLFVTGHLNPGHWVIFNAVPTTAHTIWGVLAGLVLKSGRSAAKKAGLLAAAGAVGITSGLVLDPLTPIIKRICTSSFILVSGGICLLVLALFFWLIDVRKVRRFSLFFAVVGMNPLFIYLFSHTGGGNWLRRIISPFTGGLLGWAGRLPAEIVEALLLWGLLWGICWWLYKRRIFIRI
jgi:predicted acyltransferase